MKKKLLVVCGGQSSEHSISRISCNSVMKHLDKINMRLHLSALQKMGKWYILKQEDNDLSKDTWLDGGRSVEGVFDLLRVGCCIPGTSRTLRRRWNYPGII